MWAHLAGKVDLDVYLLVSQVEDRRWSWRPSASYRSRVLRTWRLPGASGGDDALFLMRQALPAEARRSDVIVLGGWESPAYLQVFISARLRRKAVVLFYESTLATNHFHTPHPVALVRRAIVRRMDAVLTCGSASTDAVLAMGVPSDRVVTGFNAVDVVQFQRDVEEARRHTPTRAHQGHIYIFVGRLERCKNLPSLLAAFRQTAERADELHIVGEGTEMKDLTGQLLQWPPEIAKRVTFFGALEGTDLFRAYAAADTLVLPSVDEVWGMVVNESLAAGLHVVVSERVGSARSVAGMRGVFVSGVEPSSIGSAMAASRQSWLGPIAEPEILSHTPQAFAEDALRACALALWRRRGLVGGGSEGGLEEWPGHPSSDHIR
jgi:glycosyltransferase involved in cell wall biosynthesis